MKWMKTICIAVSLGVVSTCLVQAAPTLEKPVVLKETMLSVTVSDLHGLIDGIGSVAAQVSPMMNGMMLKNMLGMQLGDPGLMGIAPGKGLAIVALDPTNIFAVIEVSEAQLPAYTNALAPQGVQAKYENGLLVIAQTEQQLAKGVGLSTAVQNTLLAKRSPTLRITTRPAEIIKRNDEQIQQMLQMLPALIGQNMMKAPGATLESTQSMMKIAEGEIRVLLSLASQCEAVEVVLAPKDGSVRISETYVPKTGTRLANLGNAPVLNKPNPKIQSGYLGEGAVQLDVTIANPEALMDFCIAEIEELTKTMDLSEVNLDQWISLSKKWWAVAGGSIAETVSFDGESSINVGYLLEIKDEAAALALLKEIATDTEPLLKLYEGMGMSMSMDFKENAREYNGVKIHQLTMGMSMTNQPPEVAEELSAMNLTNMVYEIAIADGSMAYAIGAGKIESILDHIKDKTFKPTPLVARSVYPNGGFYYSDLDIGKYMEFVLGIIPEANNPMMQQVGTLFQGVEPITSAGLKANGCVMWSLNIPGELITKIGQMIMMMQMQQGGGMPQPAPVQ